MTISWDVEPDKMLERAINTYVARIRKGLMEIAERRAPEITTWMKQNRPWTDRTEDARNTLEATPEQVEAELVEILLTHGVTYGWYLEGVNPATMAEMRDRGKWAILMPAVDVWGPIIMQDIRKLVGG